MAKQKYEDRRKYRGGRTPADLIGLRHRPHYEDCRIASISGLITPFVGEMEELIRKREQEQRGKKYKRK